MGDDSKPRTVLSLARGMDKMYDIIPIKGEKYTVNQEHILCLRASGFPKICNNNYKANYNYNIQWIENNNFQSKTFSYNPKKEETISAAKEVAYKFFNDIICSDINHIHDVDYNIEICFTINENIIMESDVIAFSEKYFSLKIHSQHENNSCYIKKIELPFTHKFKKVTEVDSIICKLVYNANNLICLLRVKLYRNIDVLHIEIYFVDILIDITNNKVIEVSDIILNKGGLEFGILPSIDYPNIWNKRIDIDL
jgi:hypothetical protein